MCDQLPTSTIFTATSTFSSSATLSASFSPLVKLISCFAWNLRSWESVLPPWFLLLALAVSLLAEETHLQGTEVPWIASKVHGKLGKCWSLFLVFLLFKLLLALLKVMKTLYYTCQNSTYLIGWQYSHQVYPLECQPVNYRHRHAFGQLQEMPMQSAYY